MRSWPVNANKMTIPNDWRFLHRTICFQKNSTMYRGDCLGPTVWLKDIISSCRHTIFTRELFLHVAEVKFCLRYVESTSSGYLGLQTDIRAKLVTYAIFLVFGSLQTPHMQLLHGFKESLNDQGIIRKQTVKIRILTVPIFFVETINCKIPLENISRWRNTIQTGIVSV
jgi:hypothetical protein